MSSEQPNEENKTIPPLVSKLIESAENASAARSSSISSNTSANAATAQQQQQHDVDKRTLEELSREMIKSTGDYIRGEVGICIADYKMLERMNKTVAEKYKSLSSNSSNILAEMEKLNEAYAQLQPLLVQIESVEKSVDEMEVTAGKLDAYSKRLEAKFKQFTDRINTR